MKIHFKVFVEMKNLVRAVNALTDAGITGFYILESRGACLHRIGKVLQLGSIPSAIDMLRGHSRDAILIYGVVEKERADSIVKSVENALEGEIQPSLRYISSSSL